MVKTILILDVRLTFSERTRPLERQSKIKRALSLPSVAHLSHERKKEIFFLIFIIIIILINFNLLCGGVSGGGIYCFE